MARTEVSVNKSVQNKGCPLTVTVAASGATGADGFSIKDLDRAQDLSIFVENVGSATGPFTIKSGDYQSASVGDLTEVVAPGERKSFKLDGARFRKKDAKVDLDFGITGAFGAVQSV
jgi:hypothetical protein